MVFSNIRFSLAILVLCSASMLVLSEEKQTHLLSPWLTEGDNALNEWTGSPPAIWSGDIIQPEGSARFTLQRFSSSRRIRTHLKSKIFEVKENQKNLMANFTVLYDIAPHERCIMETQLRTDGDVIISNQGVVLKYSGVPEVDQFSVPFHEQWVDQSKYSVALSFFCYNQPLKSNDKTIQITNFSLTVV